MHIYNIIEKIIFPFTYLNKKKLRCKLEGKTILITGASFGIGEKLAYKLAEIDAHLILVARTKEKLETLKKNIEKKTAKVSVFSADLRNEKEIEKLISFIYEIPGGLDIIVSNAGKSIMRSINDSLNRYHDFTRTMAINYFAPVKLLLSLVPMLQDNKGQIINISAINVLLIPAPKWGAYQASKTAFDNWFRCAAPEMNGMGIATTSIYLPLVKTRMIEPTAAYKNMPAMSPDHVAKIICKSMCKRNKGFKPWWLIFGQIASIIFRSPWEFFIKHYMKKK